MGNWGLYVPVVALSLWVFILGLMVGSFLNVLIARLPYEKSILWPGSRCFSCYRSIRFTDNLPIIGYLRLRGKCRHCGVAFSSRYLWVEVGTGAGFLGLFLAEIVFNWHGLPNVKYQLSGGQSLPPTAGCVLFLYHACLFSLLLASAVVDAEHRIIPPMIPYTGALVGIIGGALMPWPWPQQPGALAAAGFPPDVPWIFEELWGKIPRGIQAWPFWGPLFSFAPAGSWKLGLLNSLIGALAGSLVVRVVKWLFETGFGREALGLGDADVLMMAGAFLGWQMAVMSLFVGAFVALIVFKLPGLILAAVRETPIEHELPFGPGLAVGIVTTWLSWPWLGSKVQFVFFDVQTLGLVVIILGVGMLAAGLLLRRGEPAPTEAKV
jgi:leader peptidase (prepilin peptidase) / N-methyltransferase